jgi:hypothetical protein
VTRALVAALALVACGKPSAKPEPVKAAGSGSGSASCQAQVDDLMKFLRAMDHTGSLFALDDIHLAMRPELPVVMPHQAPLVTLRATGLEYQGEKLAPAALATKLTETRKKIDEDMQLGRFSKYDPPDPLLINVLIDADTHWGDVVKLTDVLVRAGFVHTSIAFGRPSPVSPPPRTWVDDKVDELRKRQEGAATELANITRQIVPGCPPLISVFGEVGNSEGGDKVVDIIEGSGRALVACNCNIDIPAYRSVIWAIAGNPHPSTVLAVELAKTGKQLALPAATPWSEAGKQLSAGAFRFVAK